MKGAIPIQRQLSPALWCKLATKSIATETISNQWNEVVGMSFTKDGNSMFVWERGGRVYVVINNQKQLLLDISDEVGGWHDHGLLGFALHPNFDQNGFI